MAKLIHVAVGVIVGPDEKILIAKRSQTAHQGGLWEFPGGKVDADENVHQALTRELQEELAIKVLASEPLIQIRHHYPDKSVLLDVHKVTCFSGEPCGAEGQPICWVAPDELSKFEFPAANKPIIKAITLPDKYLITGEFLSEDDFCLRLLSAFERGVLLVQLRIKDLNIAVHESLLTRVIKLSETASACLLINSSIDVFEKIVSLFPDAKIGLHLNRHEAVTTSVRPVATDQLLGISCHDANEILHAQKIGADYLLLSPVKNTQSHPSAEPIGWNTFTALTELANVPVYALGGLLEKDISQSKLSGAQGVAGISAWWDGKVNADH